MTIAFFRFDYAEALPSHSDRALSVHALRGLVAVLVMLFHLTIVAPAIDSHWADFGMAHHAAAIFGFPAGRIEFFFVASGFLVARRHLDGIGMRGEARSFLRRRLIGIYATYCLVLVGVLVIGLTPLGYRSVPYPAASTIVHSLLLFGTDPHDSVLPVAWTLFHELLFYAVFAAALFNGRLGGWVAAGWTVLIVAAMAGHDVPGVPDYFASPLNLLFLFGVAGAWMLRRGWVVRPDVLAAAALLAGAALVGEHHALSLLPRGSQSLGWGLAWAMAIMSLMTSERSRIIRVPRFLVTLGDVSFMLYLTHLLLLVQLIQLLAWTHVKLPTGVVVPMLAVLTIGVAIAGHRLVELPLRRHLRRRLYRQNADIM